MRVIAGTARSVPLLSPEGNGTRPTTDRIKETLFNIISDRVQGARFLDLFAGSGQIGIEALSRGAKKATFLEKNKKVTDLIRVNLEKTRLSDNSEVKRCDVLSAFPVIRDDGPYDIIYMDPPYDLHIEEQVISEISQQGLLAQDGIIIVEAALDRKLDISDTPYEIVREKSYKTNKHIFIEEV